MKQDGLWYFWIKMNTDHLAAASWSYHAKCENMELGILLEFTGGVQPVDLGLEEIIETGRYMVFTKQNVMKLKVRACDRNVNTGWQPSVHALEFLLPVLPPEYFKFLQN